MARATDTYILKGDPAGETWKPKFTFHGFQFVEINGLLAKPDKTTIIGLVIGSDTPRVGSFETDNAMVNQLYSNIDWTQRANYVDIPPTAHSAMSELAGRAMRRFTLNPLLSTVM